MNTVFAMQRKDNFSHQNSPILWLIIWGINLLSYSDILYCDISALKSFTHKILPLITLRFPHSEILFHKLKLEPTKKILHALQPHLNMKNNFTDDYSGWLYQSNFHKTNHVSCRSAKWRLTASMQTWHQLCYKNLTSTLLKNCLLRWK